jgi:general secretion pathway protein M
VTMPTVARPVAALILLLVLTALGGFAVAVASAELAALRLERDAKTELIERLARTMPAQPAARRDAVADQRDPFTTASSESLAAAEVDRLVRAAILKATAAVLSTRAVIERETDAGARRIAVEAVVEGRVEALQRVLFNLETAMPVILVDDLAIQPAAEGGGKRADAAAPVLHASMTLSAWWRASP